MVQPVKNYHRFYATFRKLPKHGADDEVKAALVTQYTNGRTAHLHEMRKTEYTALCQAIENMMGYGDQRKRHRSICLHLMQEIGIDTKDWQRINDFCQHPRICGKVFAMLDIAELETLEVKLRAIKRKGGLKESEERRAKNAASHPNINQPQIILVDYGTANKIKPS